MNFEHIVVPLDGSEHSEYSIPQALDLAKKYGAKITFFRVIVLPPLVWNVHEIPDIDGLQRLEASACQDYLAKLASQHSAEGISIETKQMVGNPAEAIIDFAGGLNNSLIVMTSHGRDGFKRWLLGSVAEKVARHASGAVMLVRVPAERLA